jgi:hypothetical protein
MTKDEALDLALEALEKSLPRLAPYGEQDWLDSRAAITAIKQARSAPTVQPTAWPLATEEEKAGGWTLSYKFLESLSDRIDGRPAMETIESILMLTSSLTPPAQPAPVGTYGEIYESMQALLKSGLQRDQQIYMAMKDRPLYTTPPAQPAPVQPVAFEVGLVEWVGNKLMATPKVTTTPPASWMETVTANLVREGVNKHKARELAEHFYSLAQRQFVGLTNEERFALEYTPQGVKRSPIQMSFATEAKLRSKNNG